MAITGGVIHDALSSVGAVGNQIVSLDELAAGADWSLRQAPDLTGPGAAVFLATCAEESASFRTTTEYNAAHSPYAPYVGRSFGQITWRGNYESFGRWCADRGIISDARMFVNNPPALADIRYAWLGPVWYFAVHNLWWRANRGDMWTVSQAYNGGDGKIGTSFLPHGWAERKRMFDVFRSFGDSLLPSSGHADSRRIRNQKLMVL